MNNSLSVSDLQNDLIQKPTAIPMKQMDNSDLRTLKEVEASIVSAKRFPRDEDFALDKIKKACERSRLAETAIYQYPRGGTVVEGPSIRLAETVSLHWGNIQKGIRELSSTGSETTYEAFAIDLENNVRASRIFTVVHERYTKNGTSKLVDPRDVYEIIASHAARRLRACILEIIPQDVIEEALEICKQTVAKLFSKIPREERIKQMLEHFETNFKVTREHIEGRFLRSADALNDHNLLELKKIAMSLKDKMSNPEDWFKNSSPKVANKSSLNSDLGLSEKSA